MCVRGVCGVMWGMGVGYGCVCVGCEVCGNVQCGVGGVCVCVVWGCVGCEVWGECGGVWVSTMWGLCVCRCCVWDEGVRCGCGVCVGVLFVCMGVVWTWGNLGCGVVRCVRLYVQVCV